MASPLIPIQAFLNTLESINRTYLIFAFFYNILALGVTYVYLKYIGFRLNGELMFLYTPGKVLAELDQPTFIQKIFIRMTTGGLTIRRYRQTLAPLILGSASLVNTIYIIGSLYYYYFSMLKKIQNYLGPSYPKFIAGMTSISFAMTLIERHLVYIPNSPCSPFTPTFVSFIIPCNELITNEVFFSGCSPFWGGWVYPNGRMRNIYPDVYTDLPNKFVSQFVRGSSFFYYYMVIRTSYLFFSFFNPIYVAVHIPSVGGIFFSSMRAVYERFLSYFF